MKSWRAWTRSVTGLALAIAVLTAGGMPAAHGDTDIPTPKKPLQPGNGLPVAQASRVGYLPGTEGVSPSGAFTYSLPLQVPEGRAEMAPVLSLEYSSAAGDGPFGLGWSLSGMGGAVTRCAKSWDVEGTRSGVRYDANDQFCLNGQKLVAVSGTEYRAESDGFARIVAEGETPAAGPDRFVVYGKDGRVSTYEAETATQLTESVSLAVKGKVFTAPDYRGHGVGLEADEASVKQLASSGTAHPKVMWLLRTVKDRSQNEIVYEYERSSPDDKGSEFLLRKIHYTAGPGKAATRKVEFGYEPRPDPTFTYVAGVRFNQTQRVDSISMFAPNPAATTLTRAYHLTYLEDRGRSRMETVTMCGGVTPPGKETPGCLPPKIFTWSSSALEFSGQQAEGQPPVTTSGKASNPAAKVMDVDGDGIDDVLYKSADDGAKAFVRLGGRDAKGKAAPLSTTYPVSGKGGWPAEGVPPIPALDLDDSRAVDIEGDGTSELALRYQPVLDKLHEDVLRWNKTTHQFDATSTKWTDIAEYSDYGDVNGDGLPDRVVSDATLADPDDPTSQIRLMSVFLNQNGTFGAQHTSKVTGACGSTRVTDTDGDGRADVLVDVPFVKDVLKKPACGGGDATRALHADDAGVAIAADGLGPDAGAPQLPGWLLSPTAGQRYGYQTQLEKGDIDDPDGDPDDPSDDYQPARLHINALWNWLPFDGDFNGDGLLDTILIDKKRPDHQFGDLAAHPTIILWNTGRGLRWDGTEVSIPHDELATLRIGDMDGDGRDDIVSFYNTSLTCNCPSGEGDPLADPKALDSITTTSGGQEHVSVLLSKGDGTFSHQRQDLYAGDRSVKRGRPFSLLGDFNGDGRLDILRNQDSALKVLLQSGEVRERVTDVTDENAAVARTSVDYSQVWTDRPGQETNTCAAPLVCVRTGLPVVRRLTSRESYFDNSIAPQKSVYYTYADPVAHRRQGFLGFAKVSVWDDDRPAETITTYDVRTTLDGGKHYPFASVPATATTAVPVDPVDYSHETFPIAIERARVTRTTSTYEFRPLNGGFTHAVLPKTSRASTWESASDLFPNLDAAGLPASPHLVIKTGEPSTPLRRVDGDTTYDDYGNLVKDHQVTQNGVESTTINHYDLRPAVWLISLCDKQTTTRAEHDGTPAPVTRVVDNHYDERGLLDTVWVEKGNLNDQLRSTTAYEIDDAGVVTKSTVSTPGLDDQVTHIEYGTPFSGQPDEEIYASQVWGESTKPELRPSVWQVVQPALGVTLMTEDINGGVSRFAYDTIGRQVSSSGDGQPETGISYGAHEDADGKVDGVVTTTTTDADLNAGIDTGPVTAAKTVTDQLGRTRISVADGFDGANITTTADYDLLGRPTSRTRPAIGTGKAPVITSTFDNLDRPVKAKYPDTTEQSWTYTGLAVTKATDQRGTITETHRDVDGRTTAQIVHYLKSGGNPAQATTSYEYAPFDQVNVVTDDHNNKTITLYDVLGRPTRVNDPDRGVIDTTYYGTGEVHSVSHPSTIRTYSYDALGRNTSRIDHDKTGGRPDDTTTIVWDTAANGVSQIDYAVSPDGIKSAFRYDGLGRTAGTDVTVDGVTYSTDHGYDAHSRPTTLTYPLVDQTRLELTSSYNTHDFLDDLSDTTGTTAHSLWHAGTRNADLALTSGNLGADLRIVNIYDDQMGRTKSQSVVNTIDGATVHGVSYSYLGNGLVDGRVQKDASVADRHETFDYDAFNRLNHWFLTNGISPKTTTTYTYDTIGNLTDVANSTGASPHEVRAHGKPGQPLPLPHALVGNGEETYDYDAQGRQTQVTGANKAIVRKTAYTAFDLPRSVTDKNGKVTTFAYDALGTRVKESGPGGTTITIGGLFEQRTDPAGKITHIHYLNGPDGAIGQIADGKVEYTMTDALGSTGAVFDAAARKVTGTFFYDPFGARTTAAGARLTTPAGGDVTHGFTGQEHDDGLRLINMNARVYDPIMKTFLTTDLVLDNHPYSYVNSSPLNFTDPTGLDGEASGGGGEASAAVDAPAMPASGYAPVVSDIPTETGSCTAFIAAGPGCVSNVSTGTQGASDTTTTNNGGSRSFPQMVKDFRDAIPRNWALDAWSWLANVYETPTPTVMHDANGDVEGVFNVSPRDVVDSIILGDTVAHPLAAAAGVFVDQTIKNTVHPGAAREDLAAAVGVAAEYAGIPNLTHENYDELIVHPKLAHGETRQSRFDFYRNHTEGEVKVAEQYVTYAEARVQWSTAQMGQALGSNLSKEQERLSKAQALLAHNKKALKEVQSIFSRLKNTILVK